MRILLLGGTGPVGILFLRRALERDHTVVVYARSPDKIPPDLLEHPSVEVIKGSLEDVNLIRQAFSVEGGIDAVASALGPPVTGLHPKDAPIARAYERICEVMGEKGVKRIIVLGTGSIKDPLDAFDFKFKTLVTTYANLYFLA
jgi:nucleoside-diphosphate-sugar epimerase